MKTFDEIELCGAIKRALAEENYSKPTPIQAQTIPAALEGSDILGCAATGTGKTAAFALPVLNRLKRQQKKSAPNRPQVLVLAPTRELAIQIGESFGIYGRHTKIRHTLVYGGVNQNNQVRALNQGVHVLVATPGRLIDLMNQGYIKLDQLEMFILDEADRMLDMGFLPDLKRIISKLPKKRQSLFFSATMPPTIVELSKRLLYKPVRVTVTGGRKNVAMIDQKVLFLSRMQKGTELRRILSSPKTESTIVFTRTKRGADKLARTLDRDGFAATAIHGNKSQNARQRALAAFRDGKSTVLVATDVAARGIDIDGVTHVINYDMPVEPECYVHRIGRTGRAGATGIAVSFCTREELKLLDAIEKLTGKRIPSVGGSPKRKVDGRQADRERSRKNNARGGYGSSRKSDSQRSGGGAKAKRSIQRTHDRAGRELPPSMFDEDTSTENNTGSRKLKSSSGRSAGSVKAKRRSGKSASNKKRSGPSASSASGTETRGSSVRKKSSDGTAARAPETHKEARKRRRKNRRSKQRPAAV